MICVIYSQEVIFKLDLHHCFPYAVMCPFASSFLPPLIHHPWIQNSYIQQERRKREQQGDADQGHLESRQSFFENDTWPGRHLVKAHWSSSPASLPSLSGCPQYQERLIVFFLHLWLLSGLPCWGQCQDHHFCWTTADPLTEWMEKTRLS